MAMIMINIILLNPLTKLGKNILRIINKAAITRSFIKVKYHILSTFNFLNSII